MQDKYGHFQKPFIRHQLNIIPEVNEINLKKNISKLNQCKIISKIAVKIQNLNQNHLDNKAQLQKLKNKNLPIIFRPVQYPIKRAHAPQNIIVSERLLRNQNHVHNYNDDSDSIQIKKLG